MALKLTNTIEIPDSAASAFDHGAFDPKTRRVFIAHTGRDCVEVIDHDAGTHIATLPGFKEAAGVVAAEGIVLVTNRGAASLAWVDAASLETQAVSRRGLGRTASQSCRREASPLRPASGMTPTVQRFMRSAWMVAGNFRSTSRPAALVRDGCGG